MQPLEIHIPLKITEPDTIKLGINEDSESICLKIKEGGGSYPYYTGETRVTPKVKEETELQTKNRVLLENILVEEIPYYETSNIKGITFIIGGN